MPGPASARPPAGWCPVCAQGPWVSVATHLRRKHPGRLSAVVGRDDRHDQLDADVHQDPAVCGCRPCTRTGTRPEADPRS